MSDPGAPLLSDFIDPEKITYRLNTAGCFNTDDAIRALRRAHEAGSLDIVKLGDALGLFVSRLRALCEYGILISPKRFRQIFTNAPSSRSFRT